MFANTFSFWRRLVGKAAAPAANVAVLDDRRLWLRYATDLQGNVQLENGQDSEKIEAQVRDLSVGGANLLVDRPIEAGQMLTLELPAEHDELRTVLACVVRAVPEQAGKWALGCVFACELRNEDLDRIGAKKVQASSADNRTWVRFDCECNASYRKVGAAVDQPHPAQVLNISATGIGLSVRSKLHAGSLLNVDLLDRKGRMVRSILACVVHTMQRADGDYAVGCNFIRELSEDELHSLI